MQDCRNIAPDVFGRSPDLVASVVVVPLLVEGRPVGGMYFALDVPCSFDSLQDALLVRGWCRDARTGAEAHGARGRRAWRPSPAPCLAGRRHRATSPLGGRGGPA